MKQRVGILAAVIALAVMLTVVATSDTGVAHAVPLSQSTSLLQGDVDALNVILYKPYATWVADYATLRNAPNISGWTGVRVVSRRVV